MSRRALVLTLGIQAACAPTVGVPEDRIVDLAIDLDEPEQTFDALVPPVGSLAIDPARVAASVDLQAMEEARQRAEAGDGDKLDQFRRAERLLGTSGVPASQRDTARLYSVDALTDPRSPATYWPDAGARGAKELLWMDRDLRDPAAEALARLPGPLDPDLVSEVDRLVTYRPRLQDVLAPVLAREGWRSDSVSGVAWWIVSTRYLEGECTCPAGESAPTGCRLGCPTVEALRIPLVATRRRDAANWQEVLLGAGWRCGNEVALTTEVTLRGRFDGQWRWRAGSTTSPAYLATCVAREADAAPRPPAGTEVRLRLIR